MLLLISSVFIIYLVWLLEEGTRTKHSTERFQACSLRPTRLLSQIDLRRVTIPLSALLVSNSGDCGACYVLFILLNLGDIGHILCSENCQPTVFFFHQADVSQTRNKARPAG